MLRLETTSIPPRRHRTPAESSTGALVARVGVAHATRDSPHWCIIRIPPGATNVLAGKAAAALRGVLDHKGLEPTIVVAGQATKGNDPVLARALRYFATGH